MATDLFFNRKMGPSFHNDGFCYILWKIAKNPPILFGLMGRCPKRKEANVPFHHYLVAKTRQPYSNCWVPVDLAGLRGFEPHRLSVRKIALPKRKMSHKKNAAGR